MDMKRRNERQSVTWMLLVLFEVMAVATSVSGQYAIIDLGTLGGNSSWAEAINDSGQVVGHSDTGSGEQRAFLWTASGGMQDLGTLGGTSVATAINSSGQVVGYSDTSSRLRRAFLWTASGGMQDLGTLGGSHGWAFGINDSGDIAGVSHLASGRPRACVWPATGGIQDLGTLGGNSSWARAINGSGQVAGASRGTSVPAHAFRWTASGGMQDLGALGGDYSEGSHINNAGHVIGYARTASNLAHAYLWTPSSGMMDLGTLGGYGGHNNRIGSLARGVNNLDAVVGYAYTASANAHAFLWTAIDGMQDLGTLGGSQSTAMALTDSGVIVGSSNPAHSGDFHACVWIPTTFDALIEGLIDNVMALNIQQRISHSLGAKLDAALNALDDINVNNDVAAINALDAFINAVEAQQGRKITEDDATDLIAAAQAIIDQLVRP